MRSATSSLSRYAISFLALAAALPALACHGEVTAPPPPVTRPGTPTVVRIELSYSAVTLRAGHTLGVGAEAVLATGARVPLGNAVTWWSSAPDVAEVTADGLVIARAVGTAEVSAAYAGRSASVPVVVLPAEGP